MLGMLHQIPLACPIDGLPLVKTDAGFKCERNHHFDLARHGYINLLPVHYKASRDPGDSKDMIAARRNVLEAGIYQPLATAVSQCINDHVFNTSDVAHMITDAGCGDGYYTAIIADNLAALELQHPVTVLGVDISKWAIISAAKKYKHLAWAVATNKHLPVISGSTSVITSLFGFECWQPWAQLQTRGQLVVVVDAGPEHLLQIREQIYNEVLIHSIPDNSEAIAAGYEQIQQLEINFEKVIETPQLVHDIIAMTPHAHRANAIQDLQRLTQTPVQFNAVLRVYRRT
jgi:23S rRNA (guanine745-N1)-methyltransferase